jgi:hypothetical protein
MRFKNFKIRVPWGNSSVKNWGREFSDKNTKKILLFNGYQSSFNSWNNVADILSRGNDLINFYILHPYS